MPIVKISTGPFHTFHSLPFGTYGDPLVRDCGVYGELLKVFFGLVASFSCVETAACIYSDVCDEYIPTGVDKTHRECSMIDLTEGFDEYWAHGLSATRRKICRRNRGEIIIRPLDNEGEVDRFYGIYLEESSKWGGVHPYPIDLFRELYRRRGGGVVIWGAFRGGRLLGGHVDMYFGKMAQAWQAGMSEESYEYGAGVLLVVAAVEEACRRGIRFFNLGSSGGNEGLLYFKRSMGGREHRYKIVSREKKWLSWARKK